MKLFKNKVIIGVLCTLIILATSSCGCQKSSDLEDINEKVKSITLEFSNDVSFEIISGNNDLANVKVGDSFELIVGISPDSAKNKNLKYVISDEKVLSLNETNTFTANGVGETDIYAISTDGTDIKSNIVHVKVTE